MPKAVQFDQYGGLDVLEIVDVPLPHPKPSQVVVRIKAAGINPGEAKIREGAMHQLFPAIFPSGEGTDFAGIVSDLGTGAIKFQIGDEVVGFTNERASHAEYITVEEANLTPKPPSVSWEVAGALFVAGTTAYASVKAVGVKKGDKVIIAGAAGGVGSIAVQLAKAKGADVFGIAGEHDHAWLASRGIVPLSYSKDVIAQIREKVGVPDALIDTVGHGYVKMAVALGIPPERINTIADFAAAKEYGVKTEGGRSVSPIQTLAELLEMVDDGSLEVPIARAFPLENVRDAFRFLAAEHHRGKVVLVMGKSS